MSRKLRVTALGLSMSTILFGAVFVSVSSASPVGTHTASQYKSSGLTRHDIANAQKSGMPSRLVAMAPQSNLKLVARATKVGPHALDSTIKLTVGLNLRNEIKLKSFLEQVQNPHSSVYHQWLTPGEFTRLYGPTKAEVARVEQFLKAQGINVLNVSANRVLIHTEATTAKYEHVLGIRINDYRLNGRSFYSTPDSPELPRALAPLVNGILGLNGGVRMRPHLLGKTVSIQSSQAPPPATTGAYLNQLQMAKAYDWPSLTDTSNGAGETIAILSYASVGLSMSDVHSYWSGLGLPDHDVSIVNVDGSPISGGEGETTLDLEYSGAMAPGANIILYEGDNASLTTTADVINAMLTANVADVVSTSWGLCEAEVPNISTIEPLLNQAAAQGISMSAAAGDGGSSDNRLIGGSYTCDNGSNDNADFPSSSPYVLAANGTALTISDTSGTYGSETAWPHTGGGDSNVFEQPSWQTGPGVPNSGNRMNGDMAMDAGGKGLLFYLGGAWVTNGGTSFVSPEFAGLFAVADSENGSRLGQSNELLYSDVNAGNYASDFRDVTTGSNGAFNAGPNWDYPTGWGSPKVTSLLSHIGIQGPKGTLAGTVDAAASGSALVGAKITSGIHNTESQSDGSYSLTLPAAATAQTA
ncbi:MAG: S53 family peptidase, partial [Gammaproteobacteria bacterium]